ncbi:SMP-30/gluconolactonase/LRE family protein [Nocardioides immobilis]|uniref:SMP-30/gluconolactonase/LRE family protein n=1 Tax=Nocardioides immobilis TaxID=2049295 RepID=A0A417Y0U5_9ACTN|nr:SMP-30/gluconolactonase/LRE family protein [Nocardioides immobilis]RHW26216.1 SMP-30/gluconolactonase/LRE family protein [Nocardioides immobilis]
MKPFRRAATPAVAGELKDARIIARGLEFPEGPVAMSDGSVILGEIKGGAITRIDPDGTVERIASCIGGPSGLALGPDGAMYVCASGWSPDGNIGGRIDRLDLKTGTVDVLYDGFEGRRLSAPNDIVFDQHGGFYFTDYGAVTPTNHERGALYYASIDGSSMVKLRDAHFGPVGIGFPNGIGITPDGQNLLYVETFTARLFSSRIVAPGVLDAEQSVDDSFLFGANGVEWFDGLDVDAAGNVCVATLRSGCITVVAHDGSAASLVGLPEEVWEPLPTNLCFGGQDKSTVFVTLSASGTLLEAPWPVIGAARPASSA